MAPRWSALSTAERGGKLAICRASLLVVVALLAITRTADAFRLSSQLHRHQRPSSAIVTSNDIFDQDRHGYPRCITAPARMTTKPTRKTLIRMAGSEQDELGRLRRENERLKEELEGKKKKKKRNFNPLKALGEIFLPKLKSAADNDDGDIQPGQTELVSSSSRRNRDKNRSMQQGGSGTGSALDEIFRDVPFPFNLVGGVVKGMARMMDETFQDAEDDVGLVMKATQESLQRDQQASLMLGGRDVTCMSPVGKSYSKSTINGVSSVSVGLQMPARGNGKMGSVSVRASVVADNARGHRVTLQSLNLTVDGRTISVKPNDSGGRRTASGAPGVGKGEGEVVDVEYTER